MHDHAASGRRLHRVVSELQITCQSGYDRGRACGQSLSCDRVHGCVGFIDACDALASSVPAHRGHRSWQWS